MSTIHVYGQRNAIRNCKMLFNIFMDMDKNNTIAGCFLKQTKRLFIMFILYIVMLESSRAYFLKFDRVIVPMAKGDRSRVVLDLAFKLSETYKSEITALTIKEELKEVTWSDKVKVITNAYRDGKDRNIKVIPKVRTSRSIRQGITEEVSTRNYDLLMLGTFKRSLLSGSLFGGIGDYVIKNSKVPTAVFSVKGSVFPYRKILVPVSETLNTRASFSLAMHIKNALGADLLIADLRKYDRNRTHGFNTVFDNLGEMVKSYGENISIIRPSLSTSLLEELNLIIRDQRPDLIVFGVQDGKSGKIRFNSDIKNLVKSTVQDIALLKK